MGMVPETPALATMAPTRRAILVTLKKGGEARAEDLAVSLGVTASAMRQHLSSLQSDGLVSYREVRGGAGRPKHVWRLTLAAEALFPKTYSELTNELLDYVEDADSELLDAIFEKRRRRRADAARGRVKGRPFAEQVRELAAVLDEDGYLADWEELPDGSFRIVEHNCAILGVASRYGQACSSEIGFLRDVLDGAEVERVAHMMGGAHVCAYEIRPPSSSAKRAARGRASTL